MRDDYCDCRDGSDEPGTSACSGIAGGDELTFYCHNAKFRPGRLPIWAVNDGKCDYDVCCDGSDEWASGVACRDRCAEIAAAEAADREAREAEWRNGARVRSTWVQQAQAKRSEQRTALRAAEVRQQHAVTELRRAEAELARAVRQADHKENGAAEVAEMARTILAEFRDAVARAGEDDKERSKGRVDHLREQLDALDPTTQQMQHVKSIRLAVDELQKLLDAGGKLKELDALELTVIGHVEALLQGQSGGMLSRLCQLKQYVPEEWRSALHQHVDYVRGYLVEAGVLASDDSQASLRHESKAVRRARDSVAAAKKTLQETEQAVNSLRDDLAADYGRDDILRALKGRCVKQLMNDYTYEVCYMDRNFQKPPSGAAWSLGTFDAVVPDTDGLVMRYEHGQRCWNGPERASVLTLVCGAAEEIVIVQEFEKCMYNIELRTPAACIGVEGGYTPEHDEL